MTNLELDAKLKVIEKSFEESMGSIRNLSKEINNLHSNFSKLADDVNTLKGENAQLKARLKALESNKNSGQINRYE